MCDHFAVNDRVVKPRGLTVAVALALSAALFAVAVTYVHVMALARGAVSTQFMMASIGEAERPVYYGAAIAMAVIGVAVTPLWVPSLYGSARSRRWKAAVVLGALPIAVLLWSIVLASSVLVVESQFDNPLDDDDGIELAR